LDLDLDAGDYFSRSGQDLLAQQIDGPQGARARVVTELHVANEIVDAEIGGVASFLSKAAFRISDHDNVALVEVLGWGLSPSIQRLEEAGEWRRSASAGLRCGQLPRR